MADIEEIIDNFSVLDDWDDRYRYLIELGRQLQPLAASAHTEANKVQGCASQVWLETTVRPNGAAGPVLVFDGDSDAHIVRGLIAVLFAIFSCFVAMMPIKKALPYTAIQEACQDTEPYHHRDSHARRAEPAGGKL